MREKDAAWNGLTEVGAAFLFESFIAVPPSRDAENTTNPDATNLLSISNNIRSLASNLPGGNPEENQRRLKTEIIEELEKLNLKWVSQLLSRKTQIAC